MSETVRGYKVTDKNMQCLGFQYELGKKFVHDGKIAICESGFHFCKNLSDCFSYYSFSPENRVFEVVAENVEDDYYDCDKSVCSVIFFERELTWFDVLSLVNTGRSNTGISNSGSYNSGSYNSGYRNSGYRNSGSDNSGDYNSGDYNSGGYNSGSYNSGYRNSGHYNSGRCNSGAHNSGHRNSGNRNSGSDNSGDYNSGNDNSGQRNSGNHNDGNYNSGNFNIGDRHTGDFNTVTADTVLVFNKPVLVAEYEKYKKPDFLYFSLHTYDENDNIVSVLPYKQAFIESWENDDPEDRMRIKDCPNFDYDIFYEISGIDVRKYE